MEEKEERSEHVFLTVTPTVKKELDNAKDDASLKEHIIKKFIKSEVSWLEDELREMDNISIKYKARLITIKESFSESQDVYIEEINNIISVAEKKLHALSKLTFPIEEKIKTIGFEIKDVASQIGYIDVDKLERLMDVVDRYNDMSKQEKELITTLIGTKP